MQEPIRKGQVTQETAPSDPAVRNIQQRFFLMDWVRYVLAISVIIAHYNVVFDGGIYWPISSHTAVGAFFGLSGFLVYASYMRHKDAISYLTSRAKRILPAYWFIVIVCAVGLSQLSTLSIGEYFLDARFWKYLFANMCFANFLQPELPGVFTENGISAVNGSLWTLKVEWMLYLTLPLFFYTVKRFRLRFHKAISLLLIFSVVYQQTMIFAYESTGKEIFRILSYQFAGQFVYFYTGVTLYQNRKYLLEHKELIFILGSLLLVICAFAISGKDQYAWTGVAYNLLFPIGVVVTSIAVSVVKPPFPFLSKLGNCSYEMYLFHFPVLQGLATIPQFHSLSNWLKLCISLLIITIFSYTVNKFFESAWKKK